MYVLHRRLLVLRLSRVPEPGHSVYSVRNVGRVIVAVHKSAPNASRYGNFDISFSASGVYCSFT